MERKRSDFTYEDLVCAITYLVGVIDRLSEKETSIKCDSFIKSVYDKIGEVYELNGDKPKEILPELKESDDEKIRRWIIDDIRYNINNEPLNNSEYKKKAEKAIAWLEKHCEVYNSSVNNAWRPSTEHPAIDEEVIALVGENKMISFAHIVDKDKAIDYDGWNIPDVKCWIPCPKIDEN